MLRKILRLVGYGVKAVLCLMPWSLRRPLLEKFFGYRFGTGARISICSWIYPNVLEMGPFARIGPLNVAVHLERIVLGERSTVGRGNWITGYPLSSNLHFSHRSDRDPSLIVGAHSAITKSHHVDCTDRIEIGEFSTIAGYRSQFLTHSIDIHTNRQDCKPISVGNYCFVGTSCVFLGGAALPDCSVLGASSVMNKRFSEVHFLYAGNPAHQVKPIDSNAAYFTRTKGYVD